MKKIIYTPNAPSPIGPYSQATEANGVLYVSGQIALNPGTNQMMDETLEIETTQVLDNLSAVVQAAGYTLQEIVKCSIFLSSMDSFSAVNEIYGKYFETNPPARETVEVSKLPKGVNVEISAIAVK